MIVDLYRYVVSNRVNILSMLDKAHTESIIMKARNSWNEFTSDRNSNAKLAGIDSSWNLKPYHGFYLYAVDAVSIDNSGSHLVEPRYEVNIGSLEHKERGKIVYNPKLLLESMGMEFEYMLAKESVTKADMVLVDGSVMARFYNRKERTVYTFYDYARDLMREEKLIFISKRSESRSMLKGSAGDIYYFDHVSNKAGYSMPYYENVGVTTVYARLAEGVPCIKIEVPGKRSEKEIADILSVISASSISGYPYVLREAHESCKISNEDIKAIEETLGLEKEVGGREILLGEEW